MKGLETKNFKIRTNSIKETGHRARHNWQNRHRRDFIDLNVYGNSPTYVVQFELNGSLNKQNLNKAASELKIKTPSKLTMKQLIEKILDRALYFGIIDEYQYEDFIEEPTNFNKS